MKKIGSMIHKVCAFALSLVLLIGASQAASATKVYESDELIVTVGEYQPTPMTRAGSKVFIDETISQSNTFQLDEACNPRNGDYLSVDVWNMGTCDIKIDFYIDNGDDLQFSDSKIISYNSNGYHVYIESKNGEGLDCAFGLTITPIPNGEEMVADVMVNQYFK